MSSAKNPSPPALDYATPTSDARVLYAREGDRATVVIHRPERRKKATIDSAADSVGQLIFYVIIAALFLFWVKPIWLLLLIPGGLMLYGLIYGLTWLCFARLAKPIVIELTPTELTILNLDGRVRNLRLKRDGLYAIFMVSHSPAIWIRRHGQEMQGFSVTPDLAEAKRITAFLLEAAGLASGAGGEGSLASSSPP